jgi:hypothetical protein
VILLTRFLNKKAVLLIAAVIALVAIGYFAYPVLARDHNVQVEVNNQTVAFPDQKPFIEKMTSRTFVPVRFVVEALGASVGWDQGNKTVHIYKQNGDVISLKIGSKKPLLNDKEMGTLDAPAKLEKGRTLVPLRFISESLSYYVLWDGQNRLVRISDKPFVALNEITDEAKARLMAYPYPKWSDGEPKEVNYPMGGEYVEIVKELYGKDRVTEMKDLVQTKGQLKSNQKFLMHKDLIYEAEGHPWARGVLQTYQPNGEVYEQDMEFSFFWGKPFVQEGQPQEEYRWVLDVKNPLSKNKRVQ